MKCDKCGSDNTQRLQVVHENGTQHININGYSTGIGGTYHGVGVGGGHTTASGTSQTTSAKRAAPPEKGSYLGPIVGVIVGFVFMLDGSLNSFLRLLSFVLFIGSIQRVYEVKTQNDNWPNLYDKWQRSWICQKCGNIYFLPESSDNAQDN